MMNRGTHTNRGGNPQNIFGTVMPLFRLRIFVEKWFLSVVLLLIIKHALYISKRNCSRALAPACGALVGIHL